MALDRDALAKRLMGLFLTELEDHERTLDRDLLALEREPTADARGELLESVFRAAHSLKGAARAVHATAIESICHRLEHALSELRGQQDAIDPSCMQRLFEEVDAVKAAAARLRIESAVELAATQPSGPAVQVTSTSTEQAPLQPPPTQALVAVEVRAESPAARVATQKLDALLASSGELVVASSRVDARLAQLSVLREQASQLARSARLRGGHPHRTEHEAQDHAALAQSLLALERRLDGVDSGLRRDVESVSSATRRVDDAIRGLRMVPFREACEGLERSVRDLAQTLGKEVLFTLEGEHIELDRELVQRLRDPLLHLVRNAVSHGIEERSTRVAAGKRSSGRVCLRAMLRGALVEISIEDDGRGLDLPGIRARARSMGLPEVSDDDELATYAFAPGLSTALSVTEISGRGVGLDAVKRAIEALHGGATVSSTAGEGARFSLRVPLTLSKLRCLFVRVAGKHYAIPTSHVVRVLRFKAEQVLRIGGRALIRAESELVPLTSLAQLLGLPDVRRAANEQAQALVVSSAGRSVALVTHELVGERETIVQTLPPRVAASQYVSGATVLSLGQVALVLNGSELGRSAIANAARPERSVFAELKASKRRVLVVDDSITTRALVKSIVEEGGYDVTAARDGVEALRLLQAQRFDLVVSDVQMPNMDGFALTEQIRGAPKLARLPVVLVTSLEAESDRLRGLEAGANAYLGKSAFDHRVLLDVIGGLL
ncbi:MAG: hybrid sensor histidine kinase/response regulator [Myxococcaceae bacterium]|nr:hybrid sensor histidine kinase/response regulator [Myxococcaceae bacterium]